MTALPKTEQLPVALYVIAPPELADAESAGYEVPKATVAGEREKVMV